MLRFGRFRPERVLDVKNARVLVGVVEPEVVRGVEAGEVDCCGADAGGRRTAVEVDGDRGDGGIHSVWWAW